MDFQARGLAHINTGSAVCLEVSSEYLVLEEAAAERPDAGEDEVQFVPLLGTVRGCVLRGKQTLQQVAEHLQVTVVTNRRDLLELGAEARRNVLVKENGEIGAF